MNRNNFLQVIVLAYSSLFLLGLSDNVRGPIFPEILEAFRLTDFQGALFFSMSSICGVVGNYLSGRMYEHWGALPILRASFFLLIFGQMVIGLSPSFPVMMIGVVFFGFSIGLMGVAQNILIVQEIPAGPLKNRILSGLHSMYAAASLMAPLLVNLIVAMSLPLAIWRSVFIAASVLTGFVLLLSYTGKDFQESGKKLRQEAAPKGEKWAQIYFGLMLAAYVLAEILVSTRMALYLRREHQVDLTVSSWYTAIFFSGLLVGRVLFSFWSPSVPMKSQLLFFLIASFLALLLGIFIHPLGLAISSLFMAPFYPLMISAAGRLFPDSVNQALAWAIGLSSFFIVFMHVTVGFLTDLLGLKIAFLTGPAFLLTALIMIVFYEKIFRRLQHTF